MASKINRSVSPELVAPFGAPEGWEMAPVCIENNSHDIGALIRNKTTGIFRLLCGHAVFSVEQDFASKAWNEAHCE